MNFSSAHQKFKALAPEKVGHNKNAKLPMNKMFQYPELGVNPFKDRICKIFSSSHDGDCTFEDFLDMMSVFSENAPCSVKAEHAFRIYGIIFSLVDYPILELLFKILCDNSKQILMAMTCSV